MSVTLADVVQEAGYDYKNNKRDAEWLLSQITEFEWMCGEAEDLLDSMEEDYE